MKHHPDCDGYRHHSVTAVRTTYGTYVPECPLCGRIDIGALTPDGISAGSPKTAIALGAHHARVEDCDGRCKEEWT